MYLADYHTHSTCSDDGHNTMTEMARAAAREALGGRIKIQLGVELGQAAEDFERAEAFLKDAPPLDFIIGSAHNLTWEHGRRDFCTLEHLTEEEGRGYIADYIEELMELARWGKFSVLGHLTLPLRYFNENLGMHMTFAGFEDQLAALFECIIPKGIGIELNTNRGHTPLPDREILKLYRDLGGELITLGSDAHTPEYVGCAIRDRQALLRSLGYEYFMTYEKLQPVYHKL